MINRRGESMDAMDCWMPGGIPAYVGAVDAVDAVVLIL